MERADYFYSLFHFVIAVNFFQFIRHRCCHISHLHGQGRLTSNEWNGLQTVILLSLPFTNWQRHVCKWTLTITTDDVEGTQGKKITLSLLDPALKPIQKWHVQLTLPAAQLEATVPTALCQSEHSPGTHSLRGIIGQYLGCFLSQFLSKISCMAVSIARILAASSPYSFSISAILLSPGLSAGGSTERFMFL